MSRFVDVPREAFIEKMKEIGFTLQEPRANHELVFVRRNHVNEDLVVKVYSTIPAHGSLARACGEDAIRVVGVYEPKPPMKSRGYYKAKVLRVTSVDGVLERTLERAREAYSRCNEAAKIIGRKPISVRA